MVVTLDIKLKSFKEEVEVKAIANAGFESDEPEIIVPTSVAKKLKLYPKLPAETEIEEYRGAGGKKFKVYRLTKGAVKAWALTEDRSVGPVDVALAITPGEKEVLLSDKTLDALNIVLVKPGEGLWKFIDDPPEKIRKSY
ncbi:MAG: hypothetical protein DRJ31_04775 [Candidatus Methanomethylicota archaeon]|uniref:Clan AA aspartic protease n=1 Tax=Thermoproteota archaeon TaxID=2056631 RepID=A0A497EQM9_9CREN|nr:MAG: hypothetical protein DRJ31_04775 [Candidatus Verstraetearchaeota archaeon]